MPTDRSRLAAPPLPRVDLTWRQWLTFAAHCFKAIAKQHHKELAPVFRRLIAEDAIVFDVGAHAGQFAKLFARLAPRGTVYSFEPGRYARLVLMFALAANRIANVRMFPFGFSDSASAVELRMPIKRSGSFGFGLAHIGGRGEERYPEVAETVELATIDGFCAFLGIRRLDFIKGDIEGWELRMLNGGTETLQRFRPALWIEVVDRQLARAGDSRAALWARMRELRYAPLRCDANGEFVPIEQPVDGDIFWLPEERVPAVQR